MLNANVLNSHQIIENSVGGGFHMDFYYGLINQWKRYKFGINIQHERPAAAVQA